MLADERLLDLKRALRLDGLLALALPGATALAMAMVLCGLARRLLRRCRSVGRAQRQHGGNDQQFLNRQTQTASPQGTWGQKAGTVVSLDRAKAARLEPGGANSALSEVSEHLPTFGCRKASTLLCISGLPKCNEIKVFG